MAAGDAATAEVAEASAKADAESIEITEPPAVNAGHEPSPHFSTGNQ